MRGNSWVIVEIATGQAIFETFDFDKTKQIDKKLYRVIPIYEYLCELNKKIIEGVIL